MFVEDRMTMNPRTIHADAPLAQAQQKMFAEHIHHLPVLDESGRVVGILSDRDVRSAVGFDRTKNADFTVSEVMTADPVTIAGDAALDEALSIFCTHRFGALPVVSGGRLVGIITRADVLRAFHEILGLDTEGQRVDVALPNGIEDVAQAFQALHRGGQPIISAVISRMRRDGGEPSLYLRVSGSQARKVEKCLRDATLVVLEPEHS